MCMVRPFAQLSHPSTLGLSLSNLLDSPVDYYHGAVAEIIAEHQAFEVVGPVGRLSYDHGERPFRIHREMKVVPAIGAACRLAIGGAGGVGGKHRQAVTIEFG